MNERIGLFELGRAALGLAPTALRALRATLKVYTLGADHLESIGSVLEDQAGRRPERDCLLFEGRRWSYRDFNAWANRIADVLQRQGVRGGDRVALLFDNDPALLACVAALAKLGAVAGVLNPRLRGPALERGVATVRPRLLVIGAGGLGAWRSTRLPGRRDLPGWWAGPAAPPPGLSSLPAACHDASPDNPASTQTVRAGSAACLVFTSGTTGLPKAAVMTHLRWLRCGYGIGQAAMRLADDDVVYCPLPLHHNSALTLAWSAVLTSGAALALARRFSASGFWRDVRDTRATALVYVGEICRYLLAQPPGPRDRDHRVRVAVGNGLRPEIWDAFQQRFGIDHVCEFYGASEGNLVFVNAFGLPRTAGFSPLPYAIVAYDAEHERPLRDAQGFMQRVPVGHTGLLITEVSEHHPFDGYTDAKASAARLLHDVFRRGDVWLDTGDLVRAQGWRHIAFVDRLGDSFRWKGENVASSEVERVLDALPGVAKASVYGVRVAQADGRAGMAALVLEPGVAFDGRATALQLARALPAYAVPRFVRLVRRQPTTGTYKLRKTRLKREGFDPAAVADPLYVLLDRERGYEPLTAQAYRRIESGRAKL